MTERELDSVRGILWEQKWRGTLDEWPSNLPSPLVAIPKPNPIANPEKPPGQIGFGTYKWRYDPAVVLAAIEGGAGILDTAEGYGYGRVETELGKILTRAGCGETWIASKVSRNHMSESATYAAGIRSRDRLRIETIDLYQIHWPIAAKLESTLDGMARLISEKVIRRVGVCNHSANQVARAVNLSRKRGFEIVSNQIRLNSTDDGSSRYLLPYCRSLGLTVIAYSPLGQGISADIERDIRWLIDIGTYPIPASNNPVHVRMNLCANEKTRSG